VLRQAEARDRPAVVELHASPEVYTYLGGPRPRDELERQVPDVPGQRPGYFVIDLDGAAIGTVTLSRRDPERPGHLGSEADEVELSYLFLPAAWGRGYATEACTAVLDWLAGALPGQRVVLCTQTANAPSMRLAARLGFTEVERFEEYGAEQWFGMRPPSP
jgi:RimJ/RimL family protein N-acetyltransferase